MVRLLRLDFGEFILRLTDLRGWSNDNAHNPSGTWMAKQ